MRPSDADEARVIHAMDIDDSYHVERVLARGPRGVTELVTHGGVGPFVRKRMPAKLANRVVWAALADCACPRLPQVQTTFETPDEFVVVYEFVEGDTLARLVDQGGRLSVGEALPILREACEAVAALHAHGIVHRDITPTNVVLAADGAHLIDLGIVCPSGGTGESAGAAASQDEAPLGTWGFAAPEQHGFARADARSDIYALGRVLAFALTGVMPRSEGFDQALADEWLVPPAVACVIGRACDFEPSARYQSVGELVAALDAACASHLSAARAAADDEGRGEACGVSGGKAGATAASPVPMAGVRPELAGASSKQVPRRRVVRTTVMAAVPAALVLVVALLAWRVTTGGPAPEGGLSQGVGADEVQAALGSTSSSFSDDASDLDDASGPADPSEAGGPPGGSAREDVADSLDMASAPGLVGQESLAGVAFSSEESLVEQATEGLEIVETGYGAAPHGFLHVVVGIRNTSDDLLVELPVVRVTCRDDGGAIVSVTEMGTGAILPGQTIYFARPVDGGADATDLEFAVVPPNDYDVSRWSAGSPECVLSNVAEVQGTWGVSFTGEVALAGDLSVLQAVPYLYNVRVAVVLRDEGGNPIGGRETAVSIPAEGAAVPFSIDMRDNTVDYASYEVYAYLT